MKEDFFLFFLSFFFSPSCPSTPRKANMLLLAQVFLLLWVFQSLHGNTLKYQVYEEEPTGTVIARLRDDAAEVLSRVPSSVPLRFRAMQRGSAPFLSVREEDGEIGISSKIDREALCQQNVNCSIEFDVVTLPTEHLRLFHVAVEVLDINDHSPRFSRAIVPVEISESAAVGTRIPLDGATDADVGDNSLHAYALSPNDFFEIGVRTRTDGAKYAELVVTRELDREVRPGYQLQLTASDNGSPPRSGSTLLKISVGDSNDNSPAFGEQAYVIDLPENAPPGTLLVDLNATDPDEGPNGRVVYSFSSHIPAKVSDAFRIDPDDGRVTLIKRVDYESASSYELDVQATDLGPNSIPGLCKIVVRVVDVNDNKPEINVDLMTPGKEEVAYVSEEVAYVSEGAAADTFVALVRVDDGDTGLNGEVACRLHGHGHFRLQRTYENNYAILTNASLDREKRSEYSLTVIAEDRGSPSLSTIKHFAVQVLDENDNPPRFQKERYEVFKSENNSPGAYLMTAAASDPDLGANGRLTYALIEAPVNGSPVSTYVTVDPSNGAIYALKSLDHEDVARIAFTVRASDGGTPPLSANTSVLLTVLDENDNPPVIRSPALRNRSAEIPVWRYAPPGRPVVTLGVTDRDAGANGEVVCSIASGNEEGLFALDARRCELRTNGSLEGVAGEAIEIGLEVRDRGGPPLSAWAFLKLTLRETADIVPPPPPTGGGPTSADVSLIIIISLGAVCALLLMVMVAFAVARCGQERKDPKRNYNCRVAETSYEKHPKMPARHIHKADISLVPTVNGILAAQPHPRSPPASPALGSAPSHHSRQSLNSLVTISSNHAAESFALELAHATPPVEGQYQPRPSFRGNKYTRSYRYALNEMDKFSLKDSGRGDSDAGDSDYEAGRDSPLDRLLGEGLAELYHPDVHHRVHAGMRLCTEECRVLGHSDKCWMPPGARPASSPSSSSSSSDYRSNLYIPEERHAEEPPEPAPRPCAPNVRGRNRSFSTFGKDAGAGGEGDARDDGGRRRAGDDEDDDDLCGTTSLLSEMSGVFQRLLPRTLESYVQVEDERKGASSGAVGVPMSGSLDRRRAHLPGKANLSAHQQGVAAWAANTHFQNPGQHPGYHTLKPGTKLGCHNNAQAAKAGAQPNDNHKAKSHGGGPVGAGPAATQPSQGPVPIPACKWLPAMEEIPENHEEDDFECALSHLQGKPNEPVDASELVAEINKLLQEVRQS
ncbi:protocadherin-18-like isoform X2 [Stigmatopora nigra]